ncbi:MauE/DoxX family redox-associated membrane protein [Paenibacillus agaridevorans]|uniref:MauE/DoxX family redox-associated membrane protein n=1 Tax=Paenibacillus agaridevorans TaxID=171404 RepID=UPI001BE3F91A
MLDFINKVISISFSFMFMYSALNKILTFNAFVRSIEEFAILKSNFRFFSVLVVTVELVISILFASSIMIKMAFLISAIMLCVFTGALYNAFLKKIDIDCNCFGESNRKSNVKKLLIRNIILINISLFGFLLSNFTYDLFSFELFSVFYILMLVLICTTFKKIANM